MRMPALPRALILTISAFSGVLLSLGLAAAQTANSAPARKSDSVYAALAKAPRKAAARRNPLEADPDAVAAGGKLFDRHCAECHGATAEGSEKAPSLRADEVQQATPGTLFWLLTNGVVRRGMPVWSKLPEPQRWQLVSYIKSLTSARKPNADSKNAPHALSPSSHPAEGPRNPENSLPPAWDGQPAFATFPLPGHLTAVLRY